MIPGRVPTEGISYIIEQGVKESYDSKPQYHSKILDADMGFFLTDSRVTLYRMSNIFAIVDLHEITEPTYGPSSVINGIAGKIQYNNLYEPP
ncbi:hypothetical protein AM231_07460 [Paenibacillus solani]|uniref:Uncharacterized protein n=1 Tax=Paenibacillus solani TaxID=1705565 RepID=A0A0M1P3G0_9BACL|nr:hypothetical protein AM231_07460 [Paenibacillus solani]